jgi:hypothetical protein
MGTPFAPDMSNTLLLLLEYKKQLSKSCPRLWRRTRRRLTSCARHIPRTSA